MKFLPFIQCFQVFFCKEMMRFCRVIDIFDGLGPVIYDKVFTKVSMYIVKGLLATVFIILVSRVQGS